MRTSTLRPAACLWLAGVFLAVEAVYHAHGVRFDATPLDSFWQFLDPLLLRVDLMRSVWYLHGQPPAFNLLLGLVLKLGGSRWESVFHVLYGACGFGLYVGLVLLLQRLGVRLAGAATAATLFLVSPSFVLYEHWLFYTFPVATLLVMAALALAWFRDRPSPVRALLFHSLVLAMCGIQSTYQLPYFILIAAALIALHPRHRRAVVYGAALPFVLLCGLYIKNTAVFGVPSTSSWMGMSLAKMTVWYLPADTLQRLVTSRAISPISLIEPFSAPGAYPPEYFAAVGFEDVPAIGARWKSTGRENMNHIGYLRVSQQYLRDSLAVLRRHPRALAQASRDAWWIYSWSSSEYRFLNRNATHIAAWTRMVDRVVYGRRGESARYLGLLIGLTAAVAFGLASLVSRAGASSERLLLAFLVFNILWVAVVGNTFEMGENNRFRFTTDALSLAILGLMGQRAYDAFRARKAR
ncbi:MAG: hypothetical protein HY657_00805 [Acidobacteria bacterium]|nr:hypothetical protein [Acidobacteriota bacterium]